ncbi:MAG TPA: DinB family protein [Pyrinomonadaceae bacterium]
MTNPESVIAALENAPGIIIPMIREISGAVVKRRPRPGKWSAHEHACHLAEVHTLFFNRLDLMLREQSPRITPYDPDRDMDEDALLKMDLYEAMGRFSSDRRQLVERLKALSTDDWQRTAAHEEYAHYSVFIMFRHLALHDMLHAYRIEELLLKKDWEEEKK